MNEAKFLIDDEIPPPPQRGRRGTFFTMGFHQHGEKRFRLGYIAILVGLALCGLYALKVHEHTKWGVFLLGAALLVLMSLMKRYDLLGVLTRKFFILLNWVTKVWRVSAQGGRQDDDQHRFSEQLKEILSSGWFLGLGIGPMFFALLGLGIGWLNPALALAGGAAAMVSGTGMATWMAEVPPSTANTDQNNEEMALSSAIAEEAYEGLRQQAAHESAQGLTEQSVERESADSALDDDVALPFAQKPTEATIAQTLKQDLDAAIEGIDPTLMPSAEVDLAASNKQVLGNIESARATTVSANEQPPAFNSDIETLKDSVQAAISGVS